MIIKERLTADTLNGSSKTGDDSDDRSSDSKEMDDSRAASKSRRSPLRIIGDFLDSHRGRFGSTHRKAKSGEPLSLSHEPSEHRRRKGGAQPPGCEEPVGTSPPAGPEEGDDHSWPEQPPEPEPPPKDVQIVSAARLRVPRPRAASVAGISLSFAAPHADSKTFARI
ncbi:hypothetical protein IscW_ISCW021917 [Ixodes scapularis]|uniref:Uncharacterized protein n=1 Tax=Ixodes scapularis TaxID=6945 RepID=B7QC53_IXOSC|nr:hypothetical protein IscW_ISCW021917 [Ixodes scapularis]|eukprot:XP_002413117.1 hypothetical protein IscW_ISCW021917 [Ixodes scapularis]